MGFRTKILIMLGILTLATLAHFAVSLVISYRMSDRMAARSTQAIDRLTGLVQLGEREKAATALYIGLSDYRRLLTQVEREAVHSAGFFLAQSRIAKSGEEASRQAVQAVEGFLRELLPTEDRAVNGMGASFEPGAFSKWTPRFFPYIFIQGSEAVYSYEIDLPEDVQVPKPEDY